jgi:hypothetical protein
MNAILSSTTQVSFHGIGKVPLCRAENLSGIYPVYDVRYLSGSDPATHLTPTLSPRKRAEREKEAE